MIFNCLGCGVSISSKKNTCPYCKKDNIECIEIITGVAQRQEKPEWRERVKGTILSYVLR